MPSELTPREALRAAMRNDRPCPPMPPTEADLLRQRIAELEAANERLREQLRVGPDTFAIVAESDVLRYECDVCGGTGWWDGRLCPECSGTGELVGDVAALAMLHKRIAELEAEVNGLYADLGAAQVAAHNQQLILGEQMTALAVARRWAAAWKRAAKVKVTVAALSVAAEKRRSTELAIERRAVEALAEAIADETATNACCPPRFSDKHPVCADNLRIEVCARCWAAWARAEVAKGAEPDEDARLDLAGNTEQHRRAKAAYRRTGG